jgi:hypothetical protein
MMWLDIPTQDIAMSPGIVSLGNCDVRNMNIKELCLIVYKLPNQVFLNKIISYFPLCRYKEYINAKTNFIKY